MNPLGMSDEEYSDWLDLSMSGGPDSDSNDGQICRQGLYGWEDAFDECYDCEHPRRREQGFCTDGYRQRPMYDATEDEITEAWKGLFNRQTELLRSIREMREHDHDSY